MFLDDFGGRDVEPPATLANLFEHFKRIGVTPTHFDVIGGLVYILMLETGFVPADYSLHENETYSFNYSRLVALSRSFPYGKNRSTFTFHFYTPPFTNCDTKVVCLQTGDDIIVNGFVNEECFTVIIDPLLYFICKDITDLTVSKLQNLQHLSRNVKDGISFKARCVILSVNRVPFNCLTDLPAEIVRKINSYLNRAELSTILCNYSLNK